MMLHELGIVLQSRPPQFPPPGQLGGRFAWGEMRREPGAWPLVNMFCGAELASGAGAPATELGTAGMSSVTIRPSFSKTAERRSTERRVEPESPSPPSRMLVTAFDWSLRKKPIRVLSPTMVPIRAKGGGAGGARVWPKPVAEEEERPPVAAAGARKKTAADRPSSIARLGELPARDYPVSQTRPPEWEFQRRPAWSARRRRIGRRCPDGRRPQPRPRRPKDAGSSLRFPSITLLLHLVPAIVGQIERL